MALFEICLGIAAGIGLLSHLDASDTNSKANQKLNNARKRYKEAQDSLVIAKDHALENAETLGKDKKQVLDTSMKQFIRHYSKIQGIEQSKLVEKINLDMIKTDEVLEMERLGEVYDSALSSATAGAATGIAASLALTGGGMTAVAATATEVGVLGSTLATGAGTIGTALMAGNVGAAASAATGVAAGLAAPVASVLAPVTLFTGISASIKADENLSKALTVEYEVDAEISKMETQELLCSAVAEKAEMFDNLLMQLNVIFTEATASMAGVIRKNQSSFIFGRKVNFEKLSPEQQALLGATASLAQAVKQVIATDILEDDKVSDSANELAENAVAKVEQAQEIKNLIDTLDVEANPVPLEYDHEIDKDDIYSSLGLLIFIGIVVGLIYGLYLLSVFIWNWLF